MPGYLDPYSGIEWGWSAGEDNWGAATNRSLWTIANVGIHKAVKGTVSSPPSSPTIGDQYIVGANPTGWSTTPAPLANQLVVYTRTLGTPATVAWHVIAPHVGHGVFDEQIGARREYYGGTWRQLAPTTNRPIVTDNTITGDGVSTPLSVQFPTRQQSDWNVSSSSDPRYIRNKPSIPRPTPEIVLWQYNSVSDSGSLSRPTSNFHSLGRVSLSSQARYAAILGGVAPQSARGHNNISHSLPELRIGIHVTVELTGLRPGNYASISIRPSSGRQASGFLYGGSGTVTRSAFLKALNDNNFAVEMSINNVDGGGQERYSYRAWWYAGLYVDE